MADLQQEQTITPEGLYYPEQYSLIQAFSVESANNMNNFLRMILYDPSFPIDQPITSGNGILTKEGFFNISIDGSMVTVTPGSAIMTNVLIEIKEPVYLNIADIEHYLYQLEGDALPIDDGDYIINVCMKYTPTTEDSNVYIGFINEPDYYNWNANGGNDLIVLGLVHINKAGATIVATDVSYYNKYTDIGRTWPGLLVDGGVINDPIPEQNTIPEGP